MKTLYARISFGWWVTYYVMVCDMLGIKPSDEVLKRAVKIKITDYVTKEM